MESSNHQIAPIIEAVNRSDLSSIRSVVVKLLSIINDPASTAKELVDVIQTDPPLAAKVLKLVNSAHCAPRSKIDDLQQAVIFIGFETLKELALNQKVCEIFQKKIEIHNYSRKALWKHSIAVALCAKQIYRKEFGEKGENAYAAGLLHDIGVIVEDQFCNDAFLEALEAASQRDIPLWAAEKHILGFDHAEIGMALLTDWRLPKELTTAIGYHHIPHDAPIDFYPLTATTCVANLCCQQESIGFCDTPAVDDALSDSCMKSLNIKKHAIELIMDEVKETLSSMEAQGII